jgi:hypothetical protein
MHNGAGKAPDAEDPESDSMYEFAIEGLAAGDLTGDSRPEVAVVLSCHPPKTNFAVWEIQAFTDGPAPLSTLVVRPLPDALYPGVDFVAGALLIKAGRLTAGVEYYGPADCHACGPSIHRELSWLWNGRQFVQTENGRLAAFWWPITKARIARVGRRADHEHFEGIGGGEADELAGRAGPPPQFGPVIHGRGEARYNEPRRDARYRTGQQPR